VRYSSALRVQQIRVCVDQGRTKLPPRLAKSIINDCSSKVSCIQSGAVDQTLLSLRCEINKIKLKNSLNSDKLLRYDSA
jgi:hypothetical protein